MRTEAAITAGSRDHVLVSGERLRVLAPLAAIVAVGTVVWGVVALLTTSSPWIFPDELIYSELAKSIASGSAPAVRGVRTLGNGLVYPVVIAPGWLAHSGIETAYGTARIINGLVMSLTAVPSYLLARRFVSERRALLVAVFSVLVPSMVYASTLLTEVVLYPVFALAIWAVARAIEEATVGRQSVALGSMGLAFATKPLAIVLLPAFVTAVLVTAWLGRRHIATPRALPRLAFTLTGL